jgi:hypothetical protein
MKRIICITLFAIAMLVAIPTMASAQTRTIDCGTGLKLSNTAHRVKVKVFSGKRVVLKRTMRANKQFGKNLTCGKRYRAVYHSPSGHKVTRQFKVLSDEDSSDEYYADDEEAGTDLSPEEQLEEDRIWAEMEAEEQAEEACEIINAPHEDDDEWDSFACMDAYYASIGETQDDPADDGDDSDEGDE